jgi:hypothetical protein
MFLRVLNKHPHMKTGRRCSSADEYIILEKHSFNGATRDAVDRDVFATLTLRHGGKSQRIGNVDSASPGETAKEKCDRTGHLHALARLSGHGLNKTPAHIITLYPLLRGACLLVSPQAEGYGPPFPGSEATGPCAE